MTFLPSPLGHRCCRYPAILEPYRLAPPRLIAPLAPSQPQQQTILSLRIFCSPVANILINVNRIPHEKPQFEEKNETLGRLALVDQIGASSSLNRWISRFEEWSTHPLCQRVWVRCPLTVPANLRTRLSPAGIFLAKRWFFLSVATCNKSQSQSRVHPPPLFFFPSPTSHHPPTKNMTGYRWLTNITTKVTATEWYDKWWPTAPMSNYHFCALMQLIRYVGLNKYTCIAMS